MLTQPEEIRMEYLGIDKTKPDGTHIVANLPENKPTNRCVHGLISWFSASVYKNVDTILLYMKQTCDVYFNIIEF